MNNKKSIIALLLVAIIGIVGLTVAYFSNSTSITNEFETSEYGTDVTETFTSPTGWQPGDETPKVLTVKNTGEVDEAVRVKVEESWKSKNNTDLPLTQGNNVAAIINWTNTDDWTKVDVDGEDYYYYYYNYKLAPDEETSELLDKVTFNPLISASTNCTTTTTENGVTTRSCKSNGNGYDGATYTLKFTIETVQYNKYQDAWNTEFAIAEEKPHPGTLTLLEKTNPVSITNYTDGNIHEMYTFEHEATDQTPALTDYRYIGDDPYNYVYFNCDSLDNQNSETCEVWRIIGVFDVEKTNPNDASKIITEQRMKLIKGSSIKHDYWDQFGNKNDWTISTLKTYLNDEYYNELQLSAKDLIDESKYYLGSVSIDSNSTIKYGNVEKIYGEERGTTLCGACGTDESKLTWQGNVGLMYPSDAYMIYGNGVNVTCYDNPYGCSGSNATSGWLINDNGTMSGHDDNIWLLNTAILLSNSAFLRGTDGKLGNTSGVSQSGNFKRDVWPVVYLSSDVQIFDGDGSEQNPYKLKK